MSTYGESQSTSWDSSNSALISAKRVADTDVYNHAGDKLGSIDDMVVDKQSGQVRFVVMSFGGFLGIGEKYHQLPWYGLRYDEGKSGYVVNLSKAALEGAPMYDRSEIDSFDYAHQGRAIDEFYDRVDGFYSPEQQSRRNSSGVNSARLNYPDSDKVRVVQPDPNPRKLDVSGASADGLANRSGSTMATLPL